MPHEVEKYLRMTIWARLSGLAFLIMLAVIYFLEKDANPLLYFAALILELVAAFAMIGLGIYKSRYKKKHGIHHHG